MTNREFINKSISDLSKAEQGDALVLAKNLLEVITRELTDYEKEKVLNDTGIGEIAWIVRMKMR